MDSAVRKFGLNELRQLVALGQKVPMLTCYDFPTAQILEAVGFQTLLVGDSAAMTVLGYEDTTRVALAFMATITRAVRRGAPRVLLLADMPFGNIGDPATAVKNARILVEAGADVVKVECTAEQAPIVAALAAAGIACCAHLGLLPQRAPMEGGYKAKGRTPMEAKQIVQTALLLIEMGAVMVLLEAVPNEVSEQLIAATENRIPVIGCGAGPACHGHVVVLHDLLGYTVRPPKFVDALGDVPREIAAAAKKYAEAIAAGEYPADRHVYHMKKE